MHSREPIDDEHECPECGDRKLRCACYEPITTLAQLERAMEIACADRCGVRKTGKEYQCSLANRHKIALGIGDSIAMAMTNAIDTWYGGDE